MLGSILLTTALACSIISLVMYFLTFKGYKNTISFGRLFYHLMAVLVIIASAVLLYSILTHDYSFKYIYNYSSNDLPRGILAATFWAGQEGSFMLWLLFTTIVGIVLQSYTSKRGDLEERTMAVYTLVTSFLLVMVSPLFKNPFAFIWAEQIFINIKDINSAFFHQPWIQNFIFSDPASKQTFIKMNSELAGILQSSGIAINQFIIDGKGLNPQLTNFWMQIHPPILFTGFSMAAVPFCFAVAALMKNDYRNWVRQSFPWVVAGMGILGLGIMLGGYWAYEMLGWGGYWAWDPVENSSLIPWLIGVASIHTLLVQRKSQAKGGTGKYARTNLILCILTYVLVLYSTFLTRSGVLGDASVHSFVDPGTIVYLFLLIFIGTFLLIGFGMIIFRWKYFEDFVVKEEGMLSRDLALFTATVVLSASAVIVLVGTSAPLFGRSVDIFFYNEMHLPLAIIVGMLNGLSILLKWNNTKKEELLKKSITSVSLSIILTALIVVFGRVTDVLIILLAFSASFTLFVNLEIAIKILKGNLKMAGAYIAHIGIALFILGVIGSAVYSNDVDINLVKDEPKEAFGYKMNFTGLYPIENNTKYAFNIDLEKGEEKFSIAPVMYISDFNNGLMREPAILSMITKDFYISPLGYEEGSTPHQHGESVKLNKNESREAYGYNFTFIEFDFPQQQREAMMSGKDFIIKAKLIADSGTKEESFILELKNINGQRNLTSHTLQDGKTKISLMNLNAAGTVDLNIEDITEDHGHEEAEGKEVLMITASIKPFINLVWSGVLVMFFGFIFSTLRRLKESRIN